MVMSPRPPPPFGEVVNEAALGTRFPPADLLLTGLSPLYAGVFYHWIGLEVGNYSSASPLPICFSKA